MQDAQSDARQEARQGADRHQNYIGDTNAELLSLEWEGFERGYATASSAESAPMTADQIVEAAASACTQTVLNYVFLNREAFHQAFTHGWIAGYLAAQHGWRQPAKEGGPHAV